MTRTQLQSMSVRDLIEYARRKHLNLMQPDGDLVLELVERLNDCYVFSADDHHAYHRNTYSEEEKAMLTQHNPILADLTWKEAP
jgi:hypothetical protein